jgi:hypothetical protein
LTGDFFGVSSSDESESDDDAFFFLFERAAGAGTTAFFATGVTFAANQTIKIGEQIESKDLLLFGVDGGCFLLAAGATSSESELELLDNAAFDFRFALTGCVGLTFTDGFFTSSSEESDEDDESFFLFFPFVNRAFGGGIATFF